MNSVLINGEAAGQRLQVFFFFFHLVQITTIRDSDLTHAGGPLKWKSFKATPDKHGTDIKEIKTTPLKRLD